MHVSYMHMHVKATFILKFSIYAAISYRSVCMSLLCSNLYMYIYTYIYIYISETSQESFLIYPLTYHRVYTIPLLLFYYVK